MFFWRRVAPQVPEEGLKPTATPGYTRNFRELNNLVSRGKSFSGYERNSLFVNQNGNGFAEVAGLVGVDYDDDARAVATVDWDRDGDLDLWITNRTAPQVRLLKNNQPTKNSFVAIRLIGNGTTTNRDAIGARLTLSSSSEQNAQIRTVHAGDGFLAQSSSWNHFGLGDATKDLLLTVRWPGGDTQTFSDLKAGTRYTVTQGEAQPRESLPEAGAMEPQLAHAQPAKGEAKKNGFWVANPVPFPVLTFTDKSGAMRTTAEFRGRPVLINIWATWCAPCLEELADFADHREALLAQDATVLALNVDKLSLNGNKSAPAGKMEEVLARIGYDLPYGVAQRNNLAKIEVLIEYLSSRRAPLSIPSSFLVDAEGLVSAVYLEPVSWQQLSGDLAVLKSSSAAKLARASPRTGAGRWLVDPRKGIDRSAYLGDYATLFAKNGFAEESQRLYEINAGKNGGKDATAYYNQAKSAAQQGLKKQAIEFYQEAIRLNPEYGQALTGLGAILLMDRRIDEAQSLFEKALRIDPNHATALVNLAMIDQARGNKQSALKRLRRVVASSPGFAQAQFNLGSLLASMRSYEDAVQHLSKAIELQPKMMPAHMNLAVVYTKMTRWKQAETHYRIATQLSPRNGHAHYSLGNVLAQQQSHKEAVVSFRKAISLGHKKVHTLTRLGRSLRALGENQAAKNAFRQVLAMDPNNTEAKSALTQKGGGGS